MDGTHIPTAEEIHASTLEQGFNLSLLPPACTTLFKISSPRFRTCLLHEFTLILVRTRIELKRRGIDWDHLGLPEQQPIFKIFWDKRKDRVQDDNKIAFGDTQERLEALQREGEMVDKAIAQGELPLKSIPNEGIKGNTEQKKRKRTETEPNTSTVAAPNSSAGTSQTSNGLTAGSQHQGFLKPVHAHAPKKPSPLGQLSLADDM